MLSTGLFTAARIYSQFMHRENANNHTGFARFWQSGANVNCHPLVALVDKFFFRGSEKTARRKNLKFDKNRPENQAAGAAGEAAGFFFATVFLRLM
jgi:hypothetical protein